MNYLIRLSVLAIALLFACSHPTNAQDGEQGTIENLPNTSDDSTSQKPASVSPVGRVRMKFKNLSSERIIVRGLYNLPDERKFFELELSPGQVKTGFIAGTPTFYYHAFQPDGDKRWEGKRPMRIKTSDEKTGIRYLVRHEMHAFWQHLKTVSYIRMPSKEIVFSDATARIARKFRIRIRNAGNEDISFNVNGEPRIAAAKKVIIINASSINWPHIQFKTGRGDGEKIYKVDSGDYVFAWKNFDSTHGKMRLLDLYRRSTK